MPEIVQLGPLMIRTEWVLLFVSGVGGYSVIRWKLKRSRFHDMPILDRILSALMIVFVVWKLSPLLFAPTTIWKHPLLLLTLPGPDAGWWIGAAGGLIYLERNLRRLKVPKLFIGDLVSIGVAVMVPLYSLLGWQYGSPTLVPWGISIEDLHYKYHPVNVYLIMVTLPMLIWLMKNSSSLGAGKMTATFLSYYGMGLMAVSLFRLKTSTWMGLSEQQILYLFMMIIGFVLSVLLNRQRQERNDTPV